MVRLVRLLTVTTLSIGLVVAIPGAARAGAPRTTLVSRSSTGEQGDHVSTDPAISASGRFVAFGSFSANLAPGDTDHDEDVFVRDLATGTTRMVSVPRPGAPALHRRFQAGFPDISADGRYVVFTSDIPNLVQADTNHKGDVFVRDLMTNTTTRVSVSTAGHQGNGISDRPSISANGRYVAFDSGASNLVPGDSNDQSDVFVRDLVDHSTARVSLSSDDEQADDDSLYSAISANGQFVSFASSANLTDAASGLSFKVYVRDVAGGTTTLASVSSSEQQTNDNAVLSSISANGRYVAFDSDASNLVPNDDNWVDIFVRDLVAGTTTRVSVSSAAAHGKGNSFNPSIAAFGRYVAYESNASNLVPGDTNHSSDVFVHDLVNHTTRRASVSTAGEQGRRISTQVDISASGNFVAWSSLSPNLAPNDTNEEPDVFRRGPLT
jgi:Tol biopolymer transport system component